MWAWQHPNWPNFTADAKAFADRIAHIRHNAERLVGNVEFFDHDTQMDTQVGLMLSEAIATSAIEGEHLDRDSVRSSLLLHLGQSVATTKLSIDEKAAGAASLIVDVRSKYRQPLTHEILGGWQTMAIPTHRSHKDERGAYRDTSVFIVSGPMGSETTHYEALPANAVYSHMNEFLDWYNGEGVGMPGPIRAAVAHLWFELIHPFHDGNGRVGRAIADHALSQSFNFPVIACLSAAINESRNNYYQAFEMFHQRGDLDTTGFVDYFVNTIARSQEIAREEIQFVVNKTRFFDRYNDDLNPRQRKVAGRMFAMGKGGFVGGMSSKKYRAITKCPPATAARDLAGLVSLGAFTQHGQGRATRYELAPPVQENPDSLESPKVKNIIKDHLNRTNPDLSIER